jgi:hypothetical protein
VTFYYTFSTGKLVLFHSCHSCDYSHPHDKFEFTEVGGVYLNSQLPEEEVTVSQGLGLNTQQCQAKIALVALKSLKYDT